MFAMEVTRNGHVGFLLQLISHFLGKVHIGFDCSCRKYQGNTSAGILDLVLCSLIGGYFQNSSREFLKKSHTIYLWVYCDVEASLNSHH